MNMLDGYGMDTITMAGTLEAKLAAMKDAGFSQVMLMARDLVTHPGGVQAAVAAVQAAACGPRVFRCCATSKGSRGICTVTNSTSPRPCSRWCAATGSKVLLVCSSTSRHATQDLDLIAADLKSSPCWRCPWASRSPMKLCPGDAPSMNSPPAGTWCAAPIAPIWALALTLFTSLPPRHLWTPSRAGPVQDFSGAVVGLHVARNPHL